MHQLLEQQVVAFVNTITFTQSSSQSDEFLKDIENLVLSMHDIRTDSSNAHMTYRRREDWIREEGDECWDDILRTQRPGYSHVFGFIPVMEETLNSDMDINRGRSIALGVIPREMELLIKKYGKEVSRFNQDPDSAKSIVATYWDQWNKVIETQRACLMGLHKITGDISRGMEKEYAKKRKNEKKQLDKAKESQEEACPIPERPPSILKRKDRTDDRSVSSKRRKVKFADVITLTKTCKGITCENKAHLWKSNRPPAIIGNSRKQCVRCSKQITAIKKGVAFLTECIECDVTEDKKALLNKVDSQTGAIDYTKTAQLMQKVSGNISIQPGKRNSGAKGHKRGLPDPTKLIVKTVNSCLGRMTPQEETEPNKRLKLAKSLLEATQKTSDKFLKDDVKQNIALEKEIFGQVPSYNQKYICVQPVGHILKETVWTSSKNNQATKRRYWKPEQGMST